MSRVRGLCRVGLVLAALVANAVAPLAAQDAIAPASTIWLVRHAERADQGAAAGAMTAPQSDPQLSAEGRARAQELARLLADAGITRIWSTPFARTQQTAQPLAEALGLEVESYDPRDEASMTRLRAALDEPGTRHLVVGHSNTTPALVEALGADAQGAIDEFEYDRLYVVVRASEVAVSGTLLRFGAHSH